MREKGGPKCPRLTREAARRSGGEGEAKKSRGR